MADTSTGSYVRWLKRKTNKCSSVGDTKWPDLDTSSHFSPGQSKSKTLSDSVEMRWLQWLVKFESRLTVVIMKVFALSCNFLFTLEWHLMLSKGQKPSEYYFSYINLETHSILLQKLFISTDSVQMLA